MVAVVLAMLWARRWQAVTLALLAMVAVGAAVAAPAFLRAADRAVAAGQVATASPQEHTLEINSSRPDLRKGPATPNDHDVDLGRSGSALVGLPGFTYTYAEEINAAALDRDIRYRQLVAHRQDVCAHLTMVSGRCLVGQSDVVIGSATAARYKLEPGDPIPLQYARYVVAALGDPKQYYQPDGKPERVLVAGVYRVPHPKDSYWGDGHYWAADEAGRAGEPAFVTTAAFTTIDRGVVRQSIDGISGPHALDVDRLPALRQALHNLQSTVTRMGPPVMLYTGLPDLLARVDRGTGDGRQMIPVPAVVLVLLGCATVFLAVGYGTDGRRPELAVVALRGARWGTRWWLAAAESLAAIAVGTVAGCLLGQLLVNAIVAVRYPGVGSDPGFSSLRWAPYAAAAIACTALLAQWRHLHTPVSQLLRRAAAVPSIAPAVAIQAVVTLLAIVATVQLKITNGTLTGIGTFAPALIVLALAQLSARVLLPVVSWFSRRALRRGRLGVALAGFQLARRPGATPLFALIVAATAIAGYAACAVDVGSSGRRLQAELGTGAPRVLSVEAVDRSTLLSAVRGVDPDGRFAMAAARLPNDRGEPVTLAVDSSRLARVGYLPGDGPTGSQVAPRLRPAAPAPVLISGPRVTIDATAVGLRPNKPVFVAAVVSSTSGLGDAVLAYGYLREGRHSYAQDAAVCRPQCRLTALRFTEGDGGLDVTGRLVVHGAGTTWRSDSGASLAGATIDLTPLNQPTDGLIVHPDDTPFPLPAAVSGAPAGSVKGFDGRPLPVGRAITLPAVPGVGTPARLVDLEYADRLSVDAEPTGLGQVWLSNDAPADVITQLEARGLVIASDTRAAQVRSQLDRQGPAIALVFYALAAVLAVGLGAGALILAAGVDRGRRAEDLTALRGQGLGRPAVRRATLATYPALVLGAVAAGVGVALGTWWLTGWSLPLSAVDPHSLNLPGWPSVTAIVLVGAAVLVVLAGAAQLAGWATLRRIR